MKPDVLGKSYSWQTEAGTVTLVLPTDPLDFHRDDEPAPITDIPACVLPDRPGQDAIIYLVQANVAFAGDLSFADKERALAAGDAGDDRPMSEFTRRAQRLWTEGYEVAERAAHDWLTYLRVTTRQTWLGESIEPPAQYGISELLDRGRRLMAYSPLNRARVGGVSLAVGHEVLADIRDRLHAGSSPETADVFLSDAWTLSADFDVLDPRRAVLLAGMACEIKTKLTLRAKADPDKELLVGLVLNRMSQLFQILDKPFKGALGKSLLEGDPMLYGKIKQLTDTRNSVVHRGAEVDRAVAYSLVVAAKQLFDWLDNL